ncbi:ABC transporter ATP-binding protein [Cereibacter sediminicola]|uniref:ABC transporter ATP-binding protein n=1 Tax=Cereibacter sediminicola TaxID=2584941 RepID=UPI0011A4385B|nr:ATP-binding cassette domain-containing protein [Cereibacter sediminicola]
MLAMQRVGHAFLGRAVLAKVDLTVAPSEVVALVGPSGSGKSTLVHIAAGLVEPVEGRVTRGWRRQAMVFQEPRLLPWATARDNIAYPLRIAGHTRRAARTAAEDAAARVALDPADLGKYPVELSGGMRQRAAIARALVARPDFIHFDEPFTALDVALRRRMQDLVIAAAATGEFAALFVTHDLAEAARIAHRILVLDAGGRGILGSRTVPGTPGARSDAEIFARVQGWLADPLFRRIHDIDERRLA